MHPQLEQAQALSGDMIVKVSILVLVGFVAWLIRGTSAGSLLAGGVLLGGCLVILVMAACRQKVK